MINIEVVTLIFKSVQYLKFIENQINTYCKSYDNYNVTARIVANDANEKVLEALKTCSIPHTIYNDPKPNDYYLNRVYRAWNFGATSSNADLICFVNSDDAFHDDWMKPLVNLHNLNYLPASRLIESGKMPSGTHGYQINFGRHPNDFREAEWLEFVEKFKSKMMKPGGLFMPVIFDRKEFIDAGLFPEGNIYPDGAGTLNGPVLESGDAWFFRKFETLTGRKHVTPFDSLVYHIVEGEKDE
jgi:hypothetical protein